MSQIDAEEVLPEAEAGHSNDGRRMIDDGPETTDSTRLVPVAESIRYRKRAQSAEKKIELLTEQLAQAKTQAAKMSEQISDIQSEQKLLRKLSAAGTTDLETAVLLAKARLESDEQADIDGVIERLKKEKQYLFTGNAAQSRTATRKTASAKDRTQNSSGRTAGLLERAAKKAATTGNRTDLQEYLKLRRNFL